MRMRKKYSAYLLTGCMLLGMAGCGGESVGAASDLTKDYRETASGNTGDITKNDELSADFKKAYGDFAVKLLRESRNSTKEGNTFISPLSVMTALEMTRAGAKGDTLDEMDGTLYEDMLPADAKTELMRFANRLPDTKDVSFHMANSIWLTDDEKLFTPDENYLKQAAADYNAYIFEADFKNEACGDINRWVKKETDGMVKDILDEVPENAIMYLVNAMAFQGEWENTYDEMQVDEAEFTDGDGNKSSVDMMYDEEYTYLEDEHATGFVKPYKDGYAFVALLPNEDISLEDYVERLDGSTFLNLLEDSQDTKVETGLPKFTAQTSLELKDVLTVMGMPLAFDEKNADFSGMGTCSDDSNIYINRVLHKTYVDVNETGTKAAASTVVEMVSEMALEIEEPKEVILNRPFLYAIIEQDSGLPVFIGTVDSL